MIHLIALFSLILNMVLTISLIVIKDWPPLVIPCLIILVSILHVGDEIRKKIMEEK